jgi:hypothetical protein
MSLQPIPTDRRIDKGKQVEIDPAWLAWFGSIQFWLFPNGQYGPTSARPTTNLYIGRMYYDTTLHYPVWVNAISPSVVWHNASGATV